MNVRQATIEASKSDGAQEAPRGLEKSTVWYALALVPALPRKRKAPPKRGSHGNARLKGCAPRKPISAGGPGPPWCWANGLEKFSQQAAKTPAPGKCGAGANARPVATLGRRDRPARKIYVRAKLVSIAQSSKALSAEPPFRRFTAIVRPSGSRAGAAPASSAVRRRRRSRNACRPSAARTPALAYHPATAPH
jgi:hypothetical protein